MLVGRPLFARLRHEPYGRVSRTVTAIDIRFDMDGLDNVSCSSLSDELLSAVQGKLDRLEVTDDRMEQLRFQPTVVKLRMAETPEVSVGIKA